MPGSSRYDGIILGAGHNSLILQAYLGIAGLRTVCLERRPVAGGGLATIKSPSRPGFFHNTHSFYHRGVTQMPWYSDLDLLRRGAAYIEPELNVAMLLRNGSSLQWWTDFEKTFDSFARFSPSDAATLRRWRDEFLPILEEFLIPESQLPPIPEAERIGRLQQSPRGRLLLEVSRLSPLEFVQSEFQNPVIQAGLLFFNGLREVDLRAPGFGHHIPALLASRRKAQMCLGGSANLAKALIQAVQQTGGDILCNRTPRRIQVENGRATGVETEDGCYFTAPVILSSPASIHCRPSSTS